MKNRSLGHSGISIAPLIFGGNVFGWTLDEERSFELLDAFAAAGFNCIDTADSYSRWVPGNQGGESETIIGRWLKSRGNREKMIIATKVGSDMGQGKKDLSGKYILKGVENSLKRLQTDYIDLYQSHYDDPSTAVEETLEAYATLIRDGKVRVIGTSNFSKQRLSESLNASKQNGLPSYRALQPLYNLYDREPYERELAALCVDQGIGVIPYYSLASGFLSGKYRKEADAGKSPRGTGIREQYFNKRGFAILDALDQVAGETGSTPAAVALAWLLTRPAVTAPISSATSLEQLDSMIHAVRLVLNDDAQNLLDQASAWQ